jgi:hypothetical protein
LVASIGLRRQKDHPHPVLAGMRKRDSGITGRALEELMGNLQEDPRAIARARVTPLSTAMGKIFENLQALVDDAMRFLAFDIDDKAHPARILLLPGIVEPLLWGESWNVHVPYLIKNVEKCPCETGYAERRNLDRPAPYPRLNPSAE